MQMKNRVMKTFQSNNKAFEVWLDEDVEVLTLFGDNFDEDNSDMFKIGNLQNLVDLKILLDDVYNEVIGDK